jgi:exodeoxyribonuclease VII large subunit
MTISANSDPESPPARSNIPELSVSELSFAMKRTLEESFGRVRVRGELSGLKLAASGHLYADLKDADSNLNIICWRTTMGRLKITPEDGMEVVCTGKITTYPKSSRYQLIIDSMELAGEGALLKLLEDRKKKLAAEGLFDPARKKAIPFLPDVVGVVTSPTGAVIRDILHRLDDRFPRHVLVWPVIVQGAGAAEQIAAAINGFNAMPAGGKTPRPDVIIVARGAGRWKL